MYLSDSEGASYSLALEDLAYFNTSLSRRYDLEYVSVGRVWSKGRVWSEGRAWSKGRVCCEGNVYDATQSSLVGSLFLNVHAHSNENSLHTYTCYSFAKHLSHPWSRWEQHVAVEELLSKC